MQIWKSSYIFFFIYKYCPENVAFLILRIFELYTRKVCKMFVYKHTETIEYIKKLANFLEKCKIYGWITRGFLGLRMENFQGVIFYELEHIGRFSNLHWCTFKRYVVKEDVLIIVTLTLCSSFSKIDWNCQKMINPYKIVNDI